MTDSTPATAAGPWCPVCRQKVATRAFYNPLSGFHEVFADHGCDGDGRKVVDADHGFIRDTKWVASMTDSTPDTAALDLTDIEVRWLRLCGACDGGLPMNCICPTADPRATIQALVDEVRRLRNGE